MHALFAAVYEGRARRSSISLLSSHTCETSSSQSTAFGRAKINIIDGATSPFLTRVCFVVCSLTSVSRQYLPSPSRFPRHEEFFFARLALGVS